MLRRLIRFAALLVPSAIFLGAQATTVPAPGRWAIVVGVDQYQNKGILPLRGAVNDANAIFGALATYAEFPRDHIILLTSDAKTKPTKKAIFDAFREIRKKASAGDLFVFFFAGHGVERYGQRFLLTHEADNAGESELKDTSLAASQLKDELETVKVQHRLVLIDACRNDPFEPGGGPNILSESMEEALAMRSNSQNGVRATLLSTMQGQSAYEWPEKGRGLFSYFIEKGLSGEAAFMDDEVTLSSLNTYLNASVYQAARAINKEQRPFTSMNAVSLTLVRPERLTARPVTTTARQSTPRTIYGTVMDADGKPLRNASITVALAGPAERDVKLVSAPGAPSAAKPAPVAAFRASTDEKGFFRVEGLAADAAFEVQAGLAGYVETRVSATPEKAGARSIVLPRANPGALANSSTPSAAAMRATELALVADRSFLAEEFAEAEESARESLQADPDQPLANAVLGNALAFSASKDFDKNRLTEGRAKLAEARGYIDRALKEDPGLAMGYNARGLVALVEKDYEKARLDLVKATTIDSQLSLAHGNLGEVLKLQKRYGDAEKAFRTAIKIRPDSAILYNGLATVLSLREKNSDAVKAARDAIARYESRDENLGLFYVNLAIALYNQGHGVQALEAIASAKGLGVASHPRYEGIERAVAKNKKK